MKGFDSVFYDHFCRICAEKGVKPTRVVTDLHLSSGNMTNWKRGRKPKTDIAIKIADYLGVSVDYLLENDNNCDPAYKPTDEDIKFALFDGADNITDEMYEEVKRFAEYVKQRENK